MKPFRWNLKKREQLGDLLVGDTDPFYEGYEQELAECSAKVIARSANKRIVFVGRSPENIFDYLSGVLQGTEHENKLDILNISIRFRRIDETKVASPKAYEALKEHCISLGISPQDILSEPKGICFADLVSTGRTFESLFEFIRDWSIEDNLDFPAIVRKLSFIGITQRTKNSPNTWRWQQHAEWVKAHPQLTIKNVSVHMYLWGYLIDYQQKVAKSNSSKHRGNEEILLPPRDDRNIMALKQAYQIYNLGLSEKRQFSRQLSETQEFKEAWLRGLVSELRKIS